MRDARTSRKAVKRFSLYHSFHLLSKLLNLRVVLSLANDIHHVVEDVGHQLDLVIRLRVSVNWAYTLLSQLVVITLFLFVGDPVN